MKNTLSILFLFLLATLSTFSHAQYTTPSHTKGTCYAPQGKPMSKGQIRSITLYNNAFEPVFYKSFDEDLNCDQASKDGYYRVYNQENMFYLTEGVQYRLELETFNPDSSTTFTPCGIWIDYNMDSAFNSTDEFIPQILDNCRQDYRHTFDFTIPATSSGEMRMRVRSMISSTTGSSSTLEYGESIDLQFKMFSPSQFTADFWIPDTVVTNSPIWWINANPQPQFTHKWFQNGTYIGTEPNLEFKDTGSVFIKLVSTDTSGASDSVTRSIYIANPNSPPIPAFAASPSRIEMYQQILLYDLSQGNNTFMRWSIFKDQDTSILHTHWYPKLGGFNPLIVFSSKGGILDEGLSGICLEVSYDTTRPELTRKLCKADYVQVGKNKTPPVITLNGPDTICLEEPQLIFTDPGARAFDECEGDITSDLYTLSNLDHTRPGVYYIIYIAGDKDGNADTVTRMVIVGCKNAKDAQLISGKIYHDQNKNCIMDSNERGMPMLVRHNSDVQSVQPDGSFLLLLNDTGNHTINVQIPDRLKPLVSSSCGGEKIIRVEKGLNFDTAKLFFGVQFQECPKLKVDINSNRRRRCFNNTTTIQYCNEGYAPQDSVIVTVELPKYVHLIYSDHAYTVNDSGQYVFDVGLLREGQCGKITFLDSVACIQGISGITQCTKAWISPPNTCAQRFDSAWSSWDGSDLVSNGKCIGDSIIRFVILNRGDSAKGDMNDSTKYRIYTGNQLRHTSQFRLNKGESLVIETPALDEFPYRIEADQRPGHPISRFTRSILATCSDTSNNDDVGLLTRYPSDDENSSFEESCLVIVDSYDPNDKNVHPRGVTEDHFIPPASVLEYTIRFQNTGTDTAYRVTIVDTLDPHLKVTSVEFGVTSHGCNARLMQHEGRTILEFDHQGIDLPDSNTNELASQGFVKFKVRVATETQRGSSIYNLADIYFDYNLPVRTNVVDVMISDTVIKGGPMTIKEFGETTRCFLQQVSVQKHDQKLEAYLPGSKYQWLDCEDSYSAIPGEDSSIYRPDRNGIFAVQVRLLGCEDTSECTVIDNLNVNNKIPANSISIHPNPTRGGIVIDYNEAFNVVKVNVLDIYGHVTSTSHFNSSDKVELTLPAVPGIYIIQVQFDEGQEWTYKVVRL